VWFFWFNESGDNCSNYRIYGYLLGALQLWKLREEILGTQSDSQKSSSSMTEKTFHDRILSCNMMPIEMVRNLLKEEDLSENWTSSWKFYGNI